ncbi:MAG: hypothetical protein U5J82_00785 [Desulfobacterales bacterium]|jgi:Cu/Ag efflux protein CusF|nr:hypothetical protein [Desulfobacterales bacterium]
MKNPYFSLTVFILAALTAGWLYPGYKLPDLVPSAVAAGEPKVLEENINTMTATVESVDLATRMVTLKGPEGKLVEFKVGEEVKNLPQVKVGDQVVTTYYESIAAQILKPGTDPGVAAQQAVAAAKPGEKPAGAAAQQVTVTATIEAIDENGHYVTLKGPKGKSTAVKVRDPKNLEGVQVGDTVMITYTEALAISVEPAGK